MSTQRQLSKTRKRIIYTINPTVLKYYFEEAKLGWGMDNTEYSELCEWLYKKWCLKKSFHCKKSLLRFVSDNKDNMIIQGKQFIRRLRQKRENESLENYYKTEFGDA